MGPVSIQRRRCIVARQDLLPAAKTTARETRNRGGILPPPYGTGSWGYLGHRIVVGAIGSGGIFSSKRYILYISMLAEWTRQKDEVVAAFVSAAVQCNRPDNGRASLALSLAGLSS